MNADEALTFVEALLAAQGDYLNDLERQIFRGVWQDRSYKDIHHDPPACHRELDHIMRNVGPSLWKQLRRALGDDKVSKFTLKGAVEQARSRSLMPERAVAFHSAAPSDWSDRSATSVREENNPFRDGATSRQDWSTMPEVGQVYGRARELQQLEEGLTLDGCHLVALFGMSGTGKTTLAAKLAHQVKHEFDYLVWRSLHQPLSIQALIADLIHFLSNGQETSTSVFRLLHYLQNYRCLILLDGLESVLCGGVHNGAYQEGYEEYGELLKHIGQTAHQSCIVFTSWEKPKEVARMEGENQRVMALKLDGLKELAARDVLLAKGACCTESDARLINHRYDGNPFALIAIATNVREVFDGDIKSFLVSLQQGSALLHDIRALLERQFNRLSELERAVVRCLATYPEPLTLAEIVQSVRHPTANLEVQEVLQSLLRRSLIEHSATRYALSALMADYITH